MSSSFSVTAAEDAFISLSEDDDRMKVRRGRLRRIGSGKGGYWEVVH